MGFWRGGAARHAMGPAIALVLLAGTPARSEDLSEPVSAIRALASNPEAFCARIALIRSARARIDIQTYILTPDVTGSAVIHELEAAARRGVEVRLLLDDFGSHEAKAHLDVLRRLPGVEIRYINASPRTGLARRIDYLLDFRRLNRRMHNKSFMVDGEVAIVGGRNMGDVYFRQAEVVFADLDVVVKGDALADLRKVFDTYWGSAYAQPLDEVYAARNPPREPPPVSRGRAPDCPADLEPASGLSPPTPTVVLSDAPSKISLDKKAVRTADPIRDQILREIQSPVRSLYIVSPYFIPSGEWVDGLVALRARGVDVKVLTNSALATNSTPVHAAYSKYRRELLQGGVRLFEFKPTSLPVQEPDLEFGAVKSHSTLHAKTFSEDGEKVFVGSFNFDPRSVDLNTEMGLIIRSPSAAAGIESYFGGPVLATAYEVESRDGRLVWRDRTSDGEQVLTREPGLNALRRAWLAVLRAAPIEHLL